MIRFCCLLWCYKTALGEESHMLTWQVCVNFPSVTSILMITTPLNTWSISALVNNSRSTLFTAMSDDWCVRKRKKRGEEEEMKICRYIVEVTHRRVGNGEPCCSNQRRLDNKRICQISEYRIDVSIGSKDPSECWIVILINNPFMRTVHKYWWIIVTFVHKNVCRCLQIEYMVTIVNHIRQRIVTD